MEYTKLGRSNMTVSKICLGTMHFGPYADEEASHKILDRTLDMGINFIDTANAYGGDEKGLSEKIIGNWFARRPEVRDQVVLATKLYNPMQKGKVPNDEAGFSAYKARKQVKDSLERLQTDRIDLYQVHHIDRRVSSEEFWGTYERMIADGDVLYAGSSNFPGWGLAKMQLQAWQRGSVGFISEQTQYNLLNRIPELEVLPAAQDLGIGVIAYMPLAGGLLTGKVSAAEGSRTQQLEEEYDIKLGEGNDQFSQFSAVCRDLGVREHVVATAWVLHNPAVASAIVGVRKVEQLDGLEEAAGLRLESDVIKRLDEIFNINKGRKLGPGPVPEAYAW